MADPYTLTVHVADATQSLLRDGKYVVQVGVPPKDDSYDSDYTPLTLDSGQAELTAWTSDQTSTDLRFQIPAGGQKWYWVGYRLPGDENVPHTKNVVVERPTALSDPKGKWTDAFAFKNSILARSVVYQIDATAGETQDYQVPSGISPFTRFPIWVPGTGSIKVKPSSSVLVYFEIPLAGDDDVEIGDQSKSFVLTYKDGNKKLDAYFRADGKFYKSAATSA